MGGRAIRRQPTRSCENKEIKDGCEQSSKHDEKRTRLFHSLDMFSFDKPAGMQSCLEREASQKYEDQ